VNLKYSVGWMVVLQHNIPEMKKTRKKQMLLFQYLYLEKEKRSDNFRKVQMKKVILASSATWASSRNQRSNKIPVKLVLNRETEILQQGNCQEKMVPRGAITRKLNPFSNVEHKIISDLPL